uniref:glutaminase n=1 Tax=viral metagenome TaxID=1070528 RepID=A0A6C0LWP3_9ZZZZ
MDLEELENFLTDIHQNIQKINKGNVANYIPELGKVNPDLFGISVCTSSGKIIEIGNTDIDFCLQSTSKPFSYCIAREKLGRNKVHSHVGYEPSGQAFNAFVLNKQGLPHNPMINAGAIMIASLLEPDKEPSERFNLIKDSYSNIAGNLGKIGFDNSVFLSEKQHADRNMSLAYYMRENGAFNGLISPNKIQEHLDLYFQCCSILINCKIGAIMSATLANGGICPINNKKIFNIDTIKDCLTLMYGCGMYDYSGQFAFEIGLPAKSGVSGCIMLVIPNKMGVCIWSPPLDEQGNSVRGIKVCEEIVEKYNYHIFGKIVKNKLELDDLSEESLIHQSITAASSNNLEIMTSLIGKVDFNKGDYDKRTPLHLASTEGHVKMVKFLLENKVNKSPRDRWDNTPLLNIKNKEGDNFNTIRQLLQEE